MRVEDTDQERYVEGSLLSILRALHWVGIAPDEGVTFKENDEIIQVGGYGPYVQSERLPIYKKYALELLQAGHAYNCFCTAERLTELREKQQKNRLPTGYDGFCLRNVTPEEAQQRILAGEKHVVRLKMPKVGETVLNDLVRGEVRFKNELVDDQVLVKSDGFPTYHMAVVVDDHLMEITHVIRGEEWISSSPKHLQLYKCFGWEPTKFAHLSLFLNSDKSKLSKRQGDVSVDDYREKGYLPEAILNFMAFLGWNPGTEKEMYSLEELIHDFSLEKVGNTGAVVNLEKLDWFNKEYIKKLSNKELSERAKQWLDESGLGKSETALLEGAVSLERERITTLADLPEAIKFVFELPAYEKNLLVWKKGTIEEVGSALPRLITELEKIEASGWSKERIKSTLLPWIKDAGLTNGAVLWPMRVALSGQQNSPGPFDIAAVLGKNETIKRLKAAIAKL